MEVNVRLQYQTLLSRQRMVRNVAKDGAQRIWFTAPRQNGYDRIDRIFEQRGRTVRGWERVQQEYFSTAIHAGIPAGIEALVPHVGAVAPYFFDGRALKGYLDGLAAFPRWTRKQTPTNTIWTVQNPGTPARTALTFRRKDGRLVGLISIDPQTQFEWTAIDTTKVVPVWQPTPNVRKVAKFENRPAISTFEDPALEALVRKSLITHRDLRNVTVTIEGEFSRKLHLRGRDYGEESSDFRWSYVDGVFTAHRVGETVIQGRTVATEIPRLLQRGMGRPPSRYFAELVTSASPFRRFLDGSMKGRQVGQITLDGAMCDIIEMTGYSRRVSYSIRRADFRVALVLTETLDRSNRVVDRSEVRYRYGPVPLPSAFAVKVPPGVAVLPLPKLDGSLRPAGRG